MLPKGIFLFTFQFGKNYTYQKFIIRNSSNWLNVLMDKQTGPGLLELEFKRAVTVSLYSVIRSRIEI